MLKKMEDLIQEKTFNTDLVVALKSAQLFKTIIVSTISEASICI